MSRKLFLWAGGLVVVILVLGIIGNMINPEGAKKRAAEREAKQQAEQVAEALAAATPGDGSGAANGASSADTKYPSDQLLFNALNRACVPRYDKGINEVQKSLAFNQCNKERGEFASTHQITGWVGELSMIKTSQGATFVKIAIESEIDGFEIRYSTLPSESSDSSAGTLIRPGTPLFEKIAGLKERTTVRFDGVFLPSTERGINEMSFTEKGSIRSPGFTVRFTDVRPYDPSESMSSSGSDAPSGNTRLTGSALQGSVVGLPYLKAKPLLQRAGFSPDRNADTSHVVDSDPANCGNAGCSLPWIGTDGEKVCVGIAVNDAVEESQWAINSLVSGACD